MATPEQMVALEDSPEYFRTHKKHPQKALPPVKLQKYVIDYGVIDPQLKAAVEHHQKPAPLEFAAAAYNDNGQLMNSMLNQGFPAGNGAKQEALFHAVQELEVPPGALRLWLNVVVFVCIRRLGALTVDGAEIYSDGVERSPFIGKVRLRVQDASVLHGGVSHVVVK